MCDCVCTLYRWLGVYWYGNPWPFRLRWCQVGSCIIVFVDHQLGCGCIKLLKDVHMIWKAHRQAIKQIKVIK